MTTVKVVQCQRGAGRECQHVFGMLGEFDADGVATVPAGLRVIPALIFGNVQPEDARHGLAGYLPAESDLLPDPQL